MVHLTEYSKLTERKLGDRPNGAPVILQMCMTGMIAGTEIFDIVSTIRLDKSLLLDRRDALKFIQMW